MGTTAEVAGGASLAAMLSLAIAFLLGTTTSTAIDDQPPRDFYHGTSVPSALAILNGAPLDATIAAQQRIDPAPVGFYMATNPIDAEFFGARRDPGTIIQVTMTNSSIASLQSSGAQFSLIPQGAFPTAFNGQQFFIPPQAFPTFNALRASGAITITPYR